MTGSKYAKRRVVRRAGSTPIGALIVVGWHQSVLAWRCGGALCGRDALDLDLAFQVTRLGKVEG